MSIVETWPGLFYDKGGAVLNVQHPDFGAKGDGVANDTAAIQAAIDAVDGASSISIFIPAGVYNVSQLTLPTTGITILGSRLRTGTTLQQISSVSLGTQVLLSDTSSSQQKGPRLANFRVIGDATNGGNVIELKQSKGAVLENIYASTPGPNGACIRIRDSSRSVTLSRIRLRGSTATASRGLWIGDSGDLDPLTTSTWISELMMYNIPASGRFQSFTVFLDNCAQVHLRNTKLDGMESAVTFRVLSGGSHVFENIGLETVSAITTALEIEDSFSIICDNFGFPTRATNGVNIINSDNIIFRGGKMRDAIVIDSNSAWVTFENMRFQSTGDDVVTFSDSGLATRYINCVAVSSQDVLVSRYFSNETPTTYEFQRYDETGADDITAGGSFLYVTGGNANAQFFDVVAPFDGFIVGISLQVSDARTAGTLVANVQIEGANQATPTATIDGVNTLNHFNRIGGSGIAFSAGDLLKVRVVATSFTPAASSARAVVLLHRNGDPDRTQS